MKLFYIICITAVVSVCFPAGAQPAPGTAAPPLPAIQGWSQIPGPVLPAISRFIESGGYLFALSYPYVVHRVIYRSSDNGDTWRPAYNGLSDEPAMDIAELDGALFVCTMNSVFRSRDFGDSWERLQTPFHYRYTKLAPDGTDLYLFERLAYAVSTDGGDTWSDLIPYHVENLEAMTVLNGHLFAGYLNYTGVFDIDLRAAPPTERSVLPVPCIELATHDGVLYAATERGIYASSDGGSVWTVIGLQGRAVRSLSFTGRRIVACTQDNEVHTASLDGPVWEQIPCSVEPGRDYGLQYAHAFQSSQSLFLSICRSGVFRYREAEKTWEKTSAGLVESNVYQIEHAGDALFAACGKSGLHRSFDGGNTWENISGWFGLKEIYALHAEGGVLYAANVRGENMRSSDMGDTWEFVGSSAWIVPSYLGYDMSEHRLAVDGDRILNCHAGMAMGSGSDWQWLDYISAAYVRVKNGTIYAAENNGMSMSDDHGRSWILRAPPQPPGDCASFAQLMFAFDVDGDVIVGGYMKLSVTTDRGKFWSRLYMPYPNECVRVNEVELVDHTFLVSWGHGGLYRNTKDLHTWARFDEGLPFRMLIGDIHRAGNYIYLAGGNMGIWRRPVSELAITAIEPLAGANGFVLAQNYPNPASGSTTIRYTLPTAEYVTLTVTNALGQEVARLADNARMDAGTHSVPFNAEGLMPGVYFYTLRSGGTVVTKSMLVTR